MKKADMEKILIEEFDYTSDELKQENGNPLTNSVLQEMIDEEERKAEEELEARKQAKIEKANKEAEEAKRFAEEAEKEAQVSIVVDEVEEKETVFSRREIKDDDMILCMSGVNGEHVFTSELSNFTIKTSKFGQTMKIPYRDLTYVHNMSTPAFEKGIVIVMNEQIEEEFGLQGMHKKVSKAKDVKQILDMKAEDLKEFIAELPEATKVVLYDEARKAYQNGTLDSNAKIKTIENEFGISLEDNAPVDEVFQ